MLTARIICLRRCGWVVNLAGAVNDAHAAAAEFTQDLIAGSVEWGRT